MQHWWKQQHNASIGYRNYAVIFNNLGAANIQVNVVSASGVVEESTSNGMEESTSGIILAFRQCMHLVHSYVATYFGKWK